MSSPKSDFYQRITKYCAEAERCSFDVRTKLISYGIAEDEIELILQKLRQENFLDDERYTRSYVSEKWNLDHWGRIKIKNSLLQKHLDESIIDDIISTIDDEEYKSYLEELLKSKWREVQSGVFADDARRVLMYAASKGFEEELITDWLSDKSPE